MPYLPTIIYSGLILRAKWNLLSLVASAPKAAVQTLYQSNDPPAEKYRPWNYMVLQRDQRDFFYVLFFCPGLCKVDIMVRRKHVPLKGGVCHLQEFPYPTRARRITCEERTLAAGILTHWFTCLCGSVTQSVAKGSRVHDTLQNIGVLRSFILIWKIKAHLKSQDIGPSCCCYCKATCYLHILEQGKTFGNQPNVQLARQAAAILMAGLLGSII